VLQRTHTHALTSTHRTVKHKPRPLL
jgi:hypothetical protein